MGAKIAGFDAELKKASRPRWRSSARTLGPSSWRARRGCASCTSEVEGRIRDYRQLLDDNREKAEAMQEKMFGRIEEGSRMLHGQPRGDRQAGEELHVPDQALRAGRYAEDVPGRHDRRDEEGDGKLNAERSEIAEIEAQLARTRKLAEEVSAKLARFLAEKRRIEEMEGDFKKIVALSREVDLKLDTLSASNDALQQIQAKHPPVRGDGQGRRDGLRAAGEEERDPQRHLRGRGQELPAPGGPREEPPDADREADALALKVQSLRGEFDLLAGNKKDADSAMEIVGKLTAVHLGARGQHGEGAERAGVARAHGDPVPGGRPAGPGAGAPPGEHREGRVEEGQARQGRPARWTSGRRWSSFPTRAGPCRRSPG